jgi:hypothetical protein
MCLKSGVCKSISSSAQYVTLLQQIFFTSKFSYLLFCNPIHKKLKLRTASVWGTTNSKPPELIIIMMDQLEILSTIQIIFIIHFSAGAQTLLRLWPATTNCAIMLSQSHFLDPNRHVLTFLHPMVQCRITYSVLF